MKTGLPPPTWGCLIVRLLHAGWRRAGFTAELEADAHRNWDGNQRPFVPELPAWDDVLAELKRFLPNVFPDLIDRG